MKKRILVVEDDQAISKALMFRLSSAGYEVISAFDAITGMAAAAKEKPDVAILDISMPGGNGLDLAERMQNLGKTAGVPFIVITASKKYSLRQRALDLGAKAFIEKPYDPGKLLGAVRECLGEAPQPVNSTR